LECKNLYGIVFERAERLVVKTSWFGLIVQMTVMSAGKMNILQDYLCKNWRFQLAPFPRRPESMFDGVEMPVAIGICSPKKESSIRYTTSRVGRIYGIERSTILDLTVFESHENRIHNSRIAKFGSTVESVMLNRIFKRGLIPLDSITTRVGKQSVYYQEACRYWVKASHKPPFFKRNGEKMLPPHGRVVHFTDDCDAAFAACLLNSSLFYWFYSCFSDCEHVNDELVRTWPLPEGYRKFNWVGKADQLVMNLESNAEKKLINTKQGHRIEYHEINASASKPIIDQIDTLLAKHYSFTEEELDFIINYDIKYRMGLGGGVADSESDE